MSRIIALAAAASAKSLLANSEWHRHLSSGSKETPVQRQERKCKIANKQGGPMKYRNPAKNKLEHETEYIVYAQTRDGVLYMSNNDIAVARKGKKGKDASIDDIMKPQHFLWEVQVKPDADGKNCKSEKFSVRKDGGGDGTLKQKYGKNADALDPNKPSKAAFKVVYPSTRLQAKRKNYLNFMTGAD